jgi:hypothetical protein
MIFEIYDNGGKTVDRFTIYLLAQGASCDCITTDGHPEDPQGIWLHGQAKLEAVGHQERRIDIKELPLSCQLKLLSELSLIR